MEKEYSEEHMLEITNAYLTRCKYIDKQIESSLRELDNLKFPSVPLNTHDRVMSSRKFNSFADKWAELTTHINERTDQLIDLKNTISKQVDALENPMHKVLLRDYYINGLFMKEIAENLGVTRQTLHPKKREAMLSFFELYSEDIIDFWEEIQKNMIFDTIWHNLTQFDLTLRGVLCYVKVG